MTSPGTAARVAGALSTLRSPAALRPYASVAEQMLMSGSNMLVSLVVVKVAGVAAFGIYSFVFVLLSLLNGVFSTLLHRQMMLAAASLPEAESRDVFASTLALELLLDASLAGLLLLALWLAPVGSVLDAHSGVACAAGAYAVVYNLFDLYRQYLYTRDDQLYSLRCTLIFVIVQCIALAALWALAPPENAVMLAYAALALAHASSLASNRRAGRALASARLRGVSGIRATLAGYLVHARFSLVGMLVTWVQNQSMNPFLMYLAGPLVVGYFSLARLLVMPVSVISQGLVNSSTPRLRRAFERESRASLEHQIARLRRANLGVWTVWTALLGIAHLSGLSTRLVPDYAAVSWYVALWTAILLASMYRFWVGQFFVVSMQFRFMLRVGLVAALVSVSGMTIVGFGLGEPRAALVFVIVGEVVTIVLFERARRRRSDGN